MKKDFCARLKELRGHISQGVFADSIGVKQTTYSAWETGRCEPPIDKICELSAKFVVSANWLLGLPERGAPTQIIAHGDGAMAAGHDLNAVGVCSKCQLMQAHIREITGRP